MRGEPGGLDRIACPDCKVGIVSSGSLPLAAARGDHPDRGVRSGRPLPRRNGDLSWLATDGLLDTTVKLRDAATGQERTRITVSNKGMAAVAISPGGGWLACACQNSYRASDLGF